MQSWVYVCVLSFHQSLLFVKEGRASDQRRVDDDGRFLLDLNGVTEKQMKGHWRTDQRSTRHQSAGQLPVS